MEVDTNTPSMGAESKSTPTQVADAPAPVAPYVSEQKPMNSDIEMTN